MIQESNILSKLSDVIRSPDVQSPDVAKVLNKALENKSNVYETVLRLCVFSPDYHQGKARGITWNILNWWDKSKLRAKLPTGPSHLKDQAFLRFTRQPNSSVMKLAFTLFDLHQIGSHYISSIYKLCEEGRYKAACDAAVQLKLFDVFPLSTFCLALVLLDNMTTVTSYLEQSPNLAITFIQFLDDLSEDNVIKVSELIQSYPDIGKPIGASKLSHKPLDKMIKKFAEKFNLDSTYFPKSSERWAKVDLYYWIKEMFVNNNNDDHQLQLANWRDLIERKVDNNQVLKEKLVNELYSFDVHEANYWAEKFGWDDKIVKIETNNANGDEEDWETEINANTCDNQDTSDKYLQLPFSHDNIILVNTRELFSSFLTELSSSSETVVGLDAEFMCTRSDQSLCLVQISLSEKIFLLDWQVLPSVITDDDVLKFKTVLFLNKNRLISGFSIIGDIRLIAKSHKQLEDISNHLCKNILDLDCVKAQLFLLLKKQRSMLRGLAGVCETVLGKPLSKAEQIGDWSKRPLRQAQIVYAALDAWVCVQIYKQLQSEARAYNQMKRFNEIINNELNKVELNEIKSKEKKEKKEHDKQSRKALREELMKTVPELSEPLFSSEQDPLSIKLVCDDMLQGLCRKLRMFGVDCLALNNGQDHLECVTIATAESQPRYVLSKGLPAAKIAKHLPPGHTLSVKSNELDLQVEEVFRYFNMTVSDDNLFKRCVICNGGYYYELSQEQLSQLFDNIQRRKLIRCMVRPVDEDFEKDFDDMLDDMGSDDSFGDPCIGDDVQLRHRETETNTRWINVRVTSCVTNDERYAKVNLLTGDMEDGAIIQVENMVRATIDKYPQFWICGNCGKVYFEGSHWARATEQAKQLIKD